MGSKPASQGGKVQDKPKKDCPKCLAKDSMELAMFMPGHRIKWFCRSCGHEERKS